MPGNHDVPLYDIFSRFLQPLDNYRRYISKTLEPFYADEAIALLGINTARSLTFKRGRINEQQIASARARLCPLNADITKIIVTHHPFDLPDGYEDKEIVGHARIAMEMFASCGADLFLAGHLHVSHTGNTAARYKINGHSALVVQAGTATSTRGRGETNAFNVIRISHPHVTIERFTWQPELGPSCSLGPNLLSIARLAGRAFRTVIFPVRSALKASNEKHQPTATILGLLACRFCR